VRERALGALDRDERLALGDAIIAACEKADAKQLPWLLEALGDEGTDQFLPALGEIAGRSERAVQAKAFERVALIGGEAATQILRVALDDPEAFKREVALRGLYKLGAISEDDALRAITDMEENLDYAAMKVIPSATDAKLRAIVDAALQSDADWRRTTAVSALGRFGYPDDVPRLVERLKTDSSERVREAAAKALAGHPAVSDFAPLLEAARAKDEKGSVDAAVGEALAATPAGVRAALDGNLIDQYRVWKAFVTALAGQEEPPFDALVEVGHLQTPEGITSEITSEQLAFACEKLEPAQKLELARLILERGGGLGQAKAIELLKGAGSAESAALLREACGFPNVLPHRHVRDGRRVIPSGTQAIIIATEVYGSIWELILRALDPSESEKRIVEGALVENARTAIKNSDPDIRAGAIRVLAHFAPDEHAVTLLDAAEDESWEVRKAVAEALAKLTADQAAPALVQLTEKSNEEVREAVAKTVVALGGDALRPLAEKLLDDSDSDVRAVAVGTIAHFPDLTPKAVDVAQELKLHRQQKLAVETFAGLAPEKAAAVLGQVAEEAETYNLSVKAIVKLLELTQNGALSVEGCANALAGVIQGDWRGPRVAAACGLASLGSPGGLPPLLKETEGGSLPVTLGAVLCTPDREKLSPSPSRVRLVGKILFGVGTEPMGFYSVTHSAHVPIRVRRRDDAFLYGDRWALDLQEKRDALRQDSLDPAVLALAAYEDPRAAEGIENALRSDEDAKRRAAVWALALKDRAGTLVRLLENEHEDVVEEALIALRLLGHRPAIRFLAEHCQNNVDAALAVLELTILADRERKRIFSE